MTPLRDVGLGEPDECCADTMACGRGRDVEAFDRVGRSLKPAEDLQAKRSNSHLILRDGPLHAWNAAALRPGRRLAIPEASLEPCQYLWPEQSCTSTRAFFTGLPSDSRVTHTSEDSRPSLKCTLKLVTSVAART